MIVQPMQNKQAAKLLKRVAWLGKAEASLPQRETVCAPEVGCFCLDWGLLAGHNNARPAQKPGRK